MRFAGQWKNLGIWITLAKAMSEPVMGNAILKDKYHNMCVVNELNVPLHCMGLKDIIVCVSSEGILVSDKEHSSYIKPYVDGIDQ